MSSSFEPRRRLPSPVVLFALVILVVVVGIVYAETAFVGNLWAAKIGSLAWLGALAGVLMVPGALIYIHATSHSVDREGFYPLAGGAVWVLSVLLAVAYHCFWPSIISSLTATF